MTSDDDNDHQLLALDIEYTIGSETSDSETAELMIRISKVDNFLTNLALIVECLSKILNEMPDPKTKLDREVTRTAATDVVSLGRIMSRLVVASRVNRMDPRGKSVTDVAIIIPRAVGERLVLILNERAAIFEESVDYGDKIVFYTDDTGRIAGRFSFFKDTMH
jgi:hypothetical protein